MSHIVDDKHKPSSLVTPVGQEVHSEPHTGHGGTSFEGGDARAGIIVWSLSIIGLTLVVIFAITIGIQKILEANNPPGKLPTPLSPGRVIPNAPLLQVHPWEELPQVRQDAEQLLNSSGTDASGHHHIPIDQAMTAVVSRLNVAPNAPEGLTTPGGEGLDFSHSLNQMPAPYQQQRKPQAQIQGEIQKHAQ